MTVKCRSAANLARRTHFTALQVCQFAHQSKANAGTFMGSATLTFDTVEAFEHVRQLAGGDADAGVAHR